MTGSVGSEWPNFRFDILLLLFFSGKGKNYYKEVVRAIWIRFGRLTTYQEYLRGLNKRIRGGHIAL